MEKNKVINCICNALKKYFVDFNLFSCEVCNIYHEKINEEFCSKYNVDAPLATYQKSGPHIYIKINNLIGFGIYCNKIGFNNGLYDEGKYWAEIINADFIILFSENIKNEDFTNTLFQNNINILLNGFNPADNKIKKIPIYIVELSDNYENLNIKFYNQELFDFFKKSKSEMSLVIKKKITISASDCYIFGNTYNNKEVISEDIVSLSFNNVLFGEKDCDPAKIKLKFFNNIRDLERKLKLDYNVRYKINILNSRDFKSSKIRLDFKINKHDIKRLSKIEISDFYKLPPLYVKYFLKGFIDANFMYLNDNYYSGNACIKRDIITSEIKYLFELMGCFVHHNKIENINNSFLEVRKFPFIKNEIHLF